jgi:EAL domain-containing protein (putative c-di-GMP-specific phosphodiesterase class I)
VQTIRDLLDAKIIHSVYQPIVDLQTGDIIAYEALARGPSDSPFARPDVMFETARREGLLDELEWECRAAAIRGALELRMSNPASLFINVEPDALGTPIPPGHAELIERGVNEMRIIVEITERAVAARPAELLAAVQGMRALGAGIAVDDVGADDRSLAILPFLRADVIKLDLGLIQRRTSSQIAGVVHAVSAHTERTGARVLAEGIETAEHLATALSFGATLGQGWYFGRPEPLPSQLPFVKPWSALPIQAVLPDIRTSQTPFDMIHSKRPVLEANEHVLLSMSRHLEERGMDLGPRAVVLSGFQHARHVTPEILRIYTRLAGSGAFVGLFAQGISSLGLHHLAHGDLDPSDRMTREWSVNVVGPHFAAALSARELESDGPRRFAFALTHDRELVIRMTQSLLARLDQGSDREQWPISEAKRD